VKGKAEPAIINELLAKAGGLQPARVGPRGAYADSLPTSRLADDRDIS
jgi:hypothetical protein